MKEGDEGLFAAWVDTALMGSVAPLAQELKTQIFKKKKKDDLKKISDKNYLSLSLAMK